MIRSALTGIILISLPVLGWAQCCSPGNPVGGTANLSIVDKYKLRTNTFFRFGYSEGYYEGSAKSNFQYVDNASYNYAGSILTYGLLNKLNAEVELGYYFNRTQNYAFTPSFSLQGYGLNDGVFSIKYNLYKNADKELEFTGALGTKIPFRDKPQEVDNVELPVDVQPSGMAFGFVAQTFLYKGFIAKGLHLFLLNRYENGFENPNQYRFGQTFFTSFFVSKSLNHNWSFILQVRDEWRGQDQRYGQKIASSGGHLLFIAPQLNYNIRQKWNLSLLADIPVYRYYNGTQLGSKYAVSLLVTKEFDLSKKKSSNAMVN